MIFSKTPYRISLFGGGTDYPSWYEKNKGEVISASINKHVYISLRILPKFFKHNFRISYSENENSLNKIVENLNLQEKYSEAIFNVINNIEINKKINRKLKTIY